MDQTSYRAQCPLVFVSEGLQYNLIGVMPGIWLTVLGARDVTK